MKDHKESLVEWLRKYRETDDPKGMDQAIWSTFGEKRAILITDLSGFSRRTWEFGTVDMLALIQQKRELALPVFKKFGAKPCRHDADNFFAGLDTAAKALQCAIALNEAMAEYNRSTEDETRHLHICQGIGYGDILWWGDDDMYGHQVNIASKLGEDTAEADEILLTPEAVENAALDMQFKTEAMGPIYVADREFPYLRYLPG